MTPRLQDVDLDASVSKKEYERRLDDLQHDMRTIELAYRRFGLRACILLEGWDAAGKGGLIRRMTARMDPRGVQVWPIAAPQARFQGRHYLERFWARMPAPGVIAVFDRSWYGRVLVERAEELLPAPAWQRAYREIRSFEAELVASGIDLIKLWLEIDADEQLARLQARATDPRKQYKLSEADWRNHARRDAYRPAIREMLQRTHCSQAPWLTIPA